jgi:hypothetical protein
MVITEETTAEFFKWKDIIHSRKYKGFYVLVFRGATGFRVAIAIPKSSPLYGIPANKIPFTPGEVGPVPLFPGRGWNRKGFKGITRPWEKELVTVQILEYDFEHAWDTIYLTEGRKVRTIKHRANAPEWTISQVTSHATDVCDRLERMSRMVTGLLFHIPFKLIIRAKWKRIKAWFKRTIDDGRQKDRA